MVLGSSSKGNCYILENDEESLIIECGVHLNEIKKALNFSLQKVVGCLVTHEHKDHSKSLEDIMKLGINVHASKGTAEALNITDNHHRFYKIKAKQVFKVGSFKVMPFDVKHDATEPLGFIINHSESGNVLFITDSYYITDTFKNIHNIIIEANFSQEIINKKMGSGSGLDFLKDRIFKSHMSLETCKKTLQANDLSKVQKIVLIHLSDGNSDAAQFKREIEGATGKNVIVADAGLFINDFNRQPF